MDNESVALMADNTQHADLVILGRVSGVYGVSGWVKLYSYTDPRTAIFDYRECLLKSPGGVTPVRIGAGKMHGKGLVACFEGTSDRDAAAALIDAELAVPRQALPELGEGHFYWADLQGLEVLHKDGSTLGTVDYMLETGANDVIVVRGKKEILIPYLWGSVVLDVDIENGRMMVDWEWD